MLSDQEQAQERTDPLAATGVDDVAVKPAEIAPDDAAVLPPGVGIVFDYEGREHVPANDLLADLAADRPVRATVPVRADGFDPLGDDARAVALPESVGRVLVAGHPSYLGARERERRVAPRLAAGVEAAADPWVGTESVERLALATGAAQFELLARSTRRDLRALRAAGFDGTIAVYAPTVLTDDPDGILDAVGAYVARRGPVASALPADASESGTADADIDTDASASGRTREVLLAAASDYALTGSPQAIRERVDRLRAAGADRVVAYPARGLTEVL
jgi:hypothetical protein